jgi:hypothetical protein
VNIAVLLCSLVVTAGFLNATTINYLDSFVASGFLGGTAFTDSLVTITLTGDTAKVFGDAPDIVINTGSFTINVASLGTIANLTDSFELLDSSVGGPAHSGAILFADQTEGLGIIGSNDPAFGSYLLTTSIGPITDSSIIYNSAAAFRTNLGMFIIDSAGPTTFTASLVPESATITLIVFGLGGLAVLRKVNSSFGRA